MSAHRCSDWGGNCCSTPAPGLSPEYLRDMAAWRRRKARAETLRRVREASVLGLVAIMAGVVGGVVALGGAWVMGWLR